MSDRPTEAQRLESMRTAHLITRVILLTPEGAPVRLTDGSVLPPQLVRESLAQLFLAGANLSGEKPDL